MFGKKKPAPAAEPTESNSTVLVNGTLILGNVYSEAGLVIQGGVKGDVFGARVTVKPQGWIQGTLTCRELVIEQGGVVDGDVKVVDNEMDMKAASGEKKAEPEASTFDQVSQGA
jgi:cytoskeletal protein CcmA (bactofilin family)